MTRTKKTTALITLLGILMAGGIFGSQALAQENGGRRGGPPPEAFSACEGKNAGDKAAFVNRRGKR